MFYKKFRKVILVAMVVVLTFSQLSISNIKAEGTGEPSSSNSNETLFNTSSILSGRYSSYIYEHEGNLHDGADIIFENMEEIITDPSVLDSYDGQTVVRVEPNEEITFQLQAPADALYTIGLTYLSDDQNVLPAQAQMTLNGELPFYELRNLTFESKWKSPETVPLDKYGNEIVPQPIKGKEWQTKFIGDSSYRTSDPFLIELNRGENEITLRMIEGSLLISTITLSSHKELQSYESAQVEGDQFILIQGQDIAYRNDSSIRPGALFNVDLTPYRSDKRVLNYLDDNSFKRAGHRVTYELEVEESGYYYLGLNYRQNAKADFPVFMNIHINDEIPFKEFKNYPFNYNTRFTNTTVRDLETNEKIPVYLEEGSHTISFTISLDYVKPTIEAVERLINEIQSLSLEITNLAGPNADRHRDINVEEFIPGVTDQLVAWADEMNLLYENMRVHNPDVREIGAFASLTIAETQLRSLADEIDRLVVRKNELSTGTNSITAYLGNLIMEINDNGFALDQFYFYQDESDIPERAGFFQRQFSSIERLVMSFTNQDYSVDNVNPDNLQVWINRPRQYIEIIQQLIDEQFTPETGIEVDISIMPDQNKLILANAAGEAPDVAVGVNYALPFEIAIRGALQDLTEFDDFDEVKARFPAGLHVPATVKDGIYALPDTKNFWVLFYRTDILESLELPVPETIDEVRTYLPELQRRGMNFFYPTAGMPGLKLFAGTMPIIYQNGGRFYGENIGRTTLNENAAIEGMRQLTDLFTIYNIPYDVPSFYQQFRDGSLPIGISDYFMYNLILNAAPEIANSWDIALMPGIENEDGEIERWSAGGAESNIIFNDTEKSDEAWEFLKWWSSTEVQIAFGNILQTTYGEEYIWNTANMEAYAGLPWITSHKETILAQTEWVTEVPRVPGSYMLERELSNAYNSIILDGVNLRTAIDLASKRINRETARKLEEFGYIRDGEVIQHYPNPEISND